MEPLSKLDKKRERKIQEPCKIKRSKKLLENRRLEFVWETTMIYTRMNVKGRYMKNKYECPHCHEGHQSRETSELFLSFISHAELREGRDPGLVMEGRVVYLRRVIARRKVLEQELRARKPEEPQIECEELLSVIFFALFTLKFNF